MTPEQGRVCPQCGSEESIVTKVENRYQRYAGRTIRRRKCLDCGRTWVTVEIWYDTFKRMETAYKSTVLSSDG